MKKYNTSKQIKNAAKSIRQIINKAGDEELVNSMMLMFDVWNKYYYVKK